MSYVTLDPIEPDEALPDYCIHGRCTCVVCGDWCWLGSKTYDMVHSGLLEPVCRPCARTHGRGPVIARVEDHRRADGPHA